MSEQMSSELKHAIAQWKLKNPGYSPTPGTVIASLGDELAYEVASVSGGQALCFYVDAAGARVEKTFSCAEIFDVNEVRLIAITLAMREPDSLN